MNEALARLRAQALGRKGDRATLIGAAVSAVWLALVLVFWLAGPSGSAPSGRRVSTCTRARSEVGAGSGEVMGPV